MKHTLPVVMCGMVYPIHVNMTVTEWYREHVQKCFICSRALDRIAELESRIANLEKGVK